MPLVSLALRLILIQNIKVTSNGCHVFIYVCLIDVLLKRPIPMLMLKTFKFSNLFNVLVGFIMWTLFSLSITAVVFIHNGFLDGVFALLIVGPVFWYVFIYAIANSLDVIVDDRGLKRCFRGHVWYSMEWNNVKLIRKTVRKSTDMDRIKSSDATNIMVYPVNRVVSVFSPRGTMKFSYLMAGFNQFVAILNDFSGSHNFKLEEMIDGRSIPIRSL